jgi:hypothetical protein
MTRQMASNHIRRPIGSQISRCSKTSNTSSSRFCVYSLVCDRPSGLASWYGYQGSGEVFVEMCGCVERIFAASPSLWTSREDE